MNTSARVLGIGLATLIGTGSRAASEPPLTLDGATPPAVARAPARVLLVWSAPDHPWATHMYEFECRLLAACLTLNGVEAVVSPEAEWPRDGKIFEGVKSIVYYSKPAGDIVLSDAHRKEFLAMMNAGVGFAALHWGTCAWDAKHEKEYLGILGGVFHPPRSGPKIAESKLVQLVPDSPVCRGWTEYTLHEEFYLGMTFLESTVQVLRATVDGADETVAWTFERPGGGRSFGCTLAHFHDNFKIEAFRRAIVNGILWSAGVEVPEGGANVAVGDAELLLPRPAPTVK